MAKALDLFKLDGKVAVVTGGAKGLGYFMAEGLAEAGADVVICGRGKSGGLEDARERIERSGRQCLAIECDVSNENAVVAMAARVKEHFGRCDILINNAGLGGVTPSVNLSADDFARMMDVNLTGMFLCAREIGKLMIAQGGGCIINLSSENGQVGFSAGMTHYATSKSGAIGMTRSLAVEWGKHGIRVNAILPGNMEEGMMEFLQDKEGPLHQALAPPLLGLTPLGSFGTGDDMKGAAVFLASEAGRYVTGAMLVVDGGFTINSGL
ncbi:MAG: SDR family NAD(P)-dependent oxidoreductase [Alphaproteobacteria bacterium]